MQLSQLLLAQIQTGIAALLLQLSALLGLGVISISAVSLPLSTSGNSVLAWRFWQRVSAALGQTAGALGLLWLTVLALAWPQLLARLGSVMGPVLVTAGLLAYATAGLARYGLASSHTVFRWFVWVVSSLCYLVVVCLIVVAQSWMREPSGVALIDGRFQVTDWAGVLLNPHFGLQLAIAIACAFVLACVLMLALNARLKAQDVSFAFGLRWQRSLGALGVLACLGLILLMEPLASWWVTTAPAMPNLLSGQITQTGATLAAQVIFLTLIICLIRFVRELFRAEGGVDPRARRMQSLGFLFAALLSGSLWSLVEGSKGEQLVAGLPVADLVSTQSVWILFAGLVVVALLSVMAVWQLKCRVRHALSMAQQP